MEDNIPNEAFMGFDTNHEMEDFVDDPIANALKYIDENSAINTPIKVESVLDDTYQIQKNRIANMAG